MLDVFLQLQNPEGSFPRKFKDDLSIVDKSGGSTPSATLPLVMGYKYFKDKRYLESAKRTAEYLEKELISKRYNTYKICLRLHFVEENWIEMGQINNFILVKYYNKAVKGGKL